jgi:hypothetical protein
MDQDALGLEIFKVGTKQPPASKYSLDYSRFKVLDDDDDDDQSLMKRPLDDEALHQMAKIKVDLEQSLLKENGEDTSVDTSLALTGVDSMEPGASGIDSLKHKFTSQLSTIQTQMAKLKEQGRLHYYLHHRSLHSRFTSVVSQSPNRQDETYPPVAQCSRHYPLVVAAILGLIKIDPLSSSCSKDASFVASSSYAESTNSTSISPSNCYRD